MKSAAILGIKFYRVALSPFVFTSCRYQPTCSHYAEEAFHKHGFFKGVRLTVKRLARCNPFGGRGYDPVP